MIHAKEARKTNQNIRNKIQRELYINEKLEKRMKKNLDAVNPLYD